MSAPSRPGVTRRPPTSTPNRAPSARRAETVRPRFEAAPPKGSWAAVMSWKTLVLAGVVALAIALVLPSARVYFAQQEELAALDAERDAAQLEVDDLSAEIARWDDPAYIVAQARERLAYVLPGETPFRVVDPEYVTASAADSAAGMSAPDALESTPWHQDMWASIVAVGEGPTVDAPAVEDLPVTPDQQLTPVDFGG